MTKIKFIFLLVVASTLLIQPLVSQEDSNGGYEIEININGFSDTTALLAHWRGSSIYPDDTTNLDKNGRGVFEGTESLHEGLYVVYLPNGTYFDIMMGSDQKFSISNDTSDYVLNFEPKGSLENEIFADFQKYMFSKRDEMKELQEIFNSVKTEEEKEKIRAKMQELNLEKTRKIESVKKKHPELFVTKFLNATVEVKVPEELESQQEKYQYYKAHYFDNFDISDSRMLYTPLYEDKVKGYLDNVAFQHPDSLNREVDMLFARARTDSNLFSYMLSTVFNHYVNTKVMGMDAVLVYIADTYFLKEAWWASDKFKVDLKKRADALRPILIGKKAPNSEFRWVPDEHFKAAANDTALKRNPYVGPFFKVHDIPADYTVLFFWEASCSHCKKSISELYQIYTDTLQNMNVKVISVSTLFGKEGKEKWIDHVNSKKYYGWINAWNPHDYTYKEQYDIRTTPQIFLLDKDKEIIGKRIGPENILEIITVHKKIKENEESAVD